MYEFFIAPSGRPSLVESAHAHEGAVELPRSIVTAFGESPAHGLLHLATHELQTRLPPPLESVRSFACAYLTRLCQAQGHEATTDLPPTPPPPDAELTAWVLQAPPMPGLEYLRAETLAGWWADLDALVRG
jgi:hypothetical protein